MGAADEGRASPHAAVAGDVRAAPTTPRLSPSEPVQLDGEVAPVAPCSIHILGPLEVGSDASRVALGGPKQRSLFAVLVLHANEIVPTERLIELVWGRLGPRTAAHSIQIYVSELRKALATLPAPPSIATRPPGYVLDVEPDSVDAMRFERLARHGAGLVRDGRGSEAIALLQHALRLWRGAPLADFAYEEFAQPHVQRLNALRRGRAGGPGSGRARGRPRAGGAAGRRGRHRRGSASRTGEGRAAPGALRVRAAGRGAEEL